MNNHLKGKKLLILGGIDAMVEVVNRAHELGIVVYVTDYLENSPAKKVADKSFMVSTLDIDAVVELCKREGIDGILTGNVDSLLIPYAKICEAANLPCYGTVETFSIMTDKKLFKAICRENGVPTIKEYNSLDEVDEYPIVIKPVDSSGSRGISVCNNRKEALIGIEKALKVSPSRRIIIEKYMTGQEVVLYYYFQDGNPVFACMCDRYVLNQGDGVPQLPIAYIFPSRFTMNHIKNTDLLIKKMFKRIGMQNGPIFLQAFISDGCPCLYEPGYRTNGAREQYIVGNITGINSVDMLINFALTGHMMESNIEGQVDPLLHGMIACKLSPLIGRGKIKRIEGLSDVKKMKSVIATVLNNSEGDIIDEKNFGTLRQVAYRSFIIEKNKEDLKRDIDIVASKIKYYDEEGNSMMLDVFDTDIVNSYY